VTRGEQVKRGHLGLLWVACVLLCACSARLPLASPDPPPVDAQALIRRGCYSCLEAAFAAAVESGTHDTAFEAALLLTLRSKELGLAYVPWLERAHALMPSGPGWLDYVEMVASLPADPWSGDRDDILAESSRHRRPRPVIETWRQQLTAGRGSSVFRAYLDLSLACGPFLSGQRDTATEAVLQQWSDVPVLLYRAGTCGQTSLLHVLLENDPDFVEVHFELGRSALQRERPDHEEALNRFRSARAGFPASATIAASIGSIHQEREEWTDALDAYDATLALVPSHRDALLGKAISLSHLLRHDDAITSATRLLELGHWFVADAHYWRAWNEYRRGLIPAARADVDRAKALTPNAPTLILSGVIGWRERRLESAEAELEAALNLDYGQCEAASYLGGVRAERQAWPESLAAFQHAEQCFDLSVVTRRTAIEELGAAQSSAAISRQIAAHERAIAEAEMRRAAAARSAAAIRRHLSSNSR